MALLNEHLEHQVNQLLMNTDDLSSQRIDIVANNGQITLEGNVQSFRRKLAAQQVVETCPNVTTVVNNLAVATPESTPDLEIASNVNRQLASDKRLAVSTIRVDARSGSVTLSGYVSTQAEKQLAADIATSADGVDEINNLLVVNSDRVLANQEHANTVRASIGRIIGMEDEQIIVSIVDETARLSGVVDSLWKKETAEKTVRQFGILNVCNEIKVNL